MEPRLNIITLGCANLDRSRKFYTDGLKWRESSASKREIVFYDLGPIALALYPRTLLAEDANVPGQGEGFSGITLAQNVHWKQDVNIILDRARAAGGTVLKPAADTFWGGYSGYFADPNGYAWEIAWNPHWTLSPDGKLQLP